MIYCLDASTFIAILRRRSATALAKLAAMDAEAVKIPEMTRAELIVGVIKGASAGGRERLEATLEPYELLPFAGDAAEHYAEIRCQLESEGISIGGNDLIIAATARAAGAILVTHNTNEFTRVPNLQIEDWVTDA